MNKVKVWDGEGLPPVGCECEREVSGGWGKCKINYASSALIVYQMLDSGNEYASTMTGFGFRPIRTEAERQRESVVNDLVEIMVYFNSNPKGDKSYKSLAERIFDVVAIGKIPGIRLTDDAGSQ